MSSTAPVLDRMPPPDRNGLRLRFAIWLVLVASLAGVFVTQVRPALLLETDITAMLPQTAVDGGVAHALERFAVAAGRRCLFLVESADFDAARAAATALASVLRASPAFESVELERDFDPAGLEAALLPYRHGLLSDRHRTLLASGRAEVIAEEALQALYTPAGLTRALPFAADPLNLYGAFLADQPAGPGTVHLRGGVLAIEHAAGHGVLVTATLRDSPFALGAQDAAMAALRDAQTAATAAAPGVEVLASGVLRHAAANSARAKREIGLFGGLSAAGVLLIFLLCFRSLRPLLLVLAALGTGVLAAVIAVQMLFGRLHLLALVFGSSLIGVAADYAIHFFSDQFRRPGSWSGAEARAHVAPAIVVGMGTTTLGYLAFLAMPFPGLRQMAVFSVAGIVAAGVTVLLAFPLLAGTGRAPPAWLGALSARLDALRRPRGPALRLALIGGALLTGIGLLRLEFADDLRALQSSPEALRAEEARVSERLGGASDTRFFLVEGADAEAVLRLEEALRARLDALVAQGALGHYAALSRSLPSALRQTENRRLLAAQVHADDGALPQLLARLGFDREAAARLRAEFEAGADSTLTLEQWLETESSAPYRALWLGADDDGVSSAVGLSGVGDLEALRSSATGLEGVRLIDRVADISAVLQHYRRMALGGLAVAVLAIGAVLALRYGLRDAPRQMLPPVGGCLLTLAVLGLAGVPANLFTVLALLLVLGLGVDYGVFLREGRDARRSALIAISVAAATTLLAFGMLSASATPFIRSLGLGVLLGVACTWLLAVFATAAPDGPIPASRGNST